MSTIDPGQFRPITSGEVEEFIFELYSLLQPGRDSNLGYISRTNQFLEVTIGTRPTGFTGKHKKSGKNTRKPKKLSEWSFEEPRFLPRFAELQIEQSPSGVNSGTEVNTTGFLLWKVSPLFADWMLNCSANPFSRYIREFGSRLSVVELGAGTSGILAVALGPQFRKYIATDQKHVLKLLRRNIRRNVDNCVYSATITDPSSDTENSNGGVFVSAPQMAETRVEAVEFDWENIDATVENVREILMEEITEEVSELTETEAEAEADFVLACDTVYNEHLVLLFMEALRAVCGLKTVALVALQLRDPVVLEAFLSEALQPTSGAPFDVWMVPAEFLTRELKDGFAIFYLRKKSEEIIR